MVSKPSTNESPEPYNPLTQLAQKARAEVDSLQRELGEIEVLIKQAALEIERAQNHSLEAESKLREIEKSPDSFTRAEFRDALLSYQEAQMRLFMMNAQSEQLEYKRASLQRHETSLREVIASIEDAVAGLAEQRPFEDTLQPGPLRHSSNLDAEPAAVQDISRIIDAQEDERLRIAHRIHDGPAQSLANLILRAEICERLIDSEPEIARSELAGLKEVIVNTLHDTRQFIFDLRPMILDDLGLVPTLRRYIESLSERRDVHISLSVSGAERRLPMPIEIALFRIAQEAIENAMAHGKAKEIAVAIGMETDAEAVSLTVRDNGSGFDANRLLQASRPVNLYGVDGMHQRAKALGGIVTIESKRGQGTTVRAEIPLQHAAAGTTGQ